MRLSDLSPAQLSALYNAEMKTAFPPDELKPLKSMLTLLEQGRYRALGLYEGEELLAYALLWLEPDIPFALLDYLGTVEGQRSRGLGTRLLTELASAFSGYRGIFGEAEAPENGDPADEPLRRRRLDFYLRSGFRYGGYDCALFGVHYQTIIHGAEDVTAEELLDAHRRIYRRGLPPEIHDRFIQIPLLPGEAVRSAADWIEE